MPSFVISEIVMRNRNLAEINYFYKILSENILLLPSYYSVSTISKFKFDGKDMIELLIKEPVEITFPSINISFKSEIKIFIYFTTVKRHRLLVISSPRGIGLSRKDGLRRYIDLTVWQNFLEGLLSNNQATYRPVVFSSDHLDSQNWGDELIEINVSIHEFGKVKLRSRKLQSNINTLGGIINFEKLLARGEIYRIKVKSHSLRKVVDIRRDGIIKVNEKDNLKVLKYLIDILVRII